MNDGEETINEDLFSFDIGGAQPERQVMPYGELLTCVTALMQSCEGCEKVSVAGVTARCSPRVDLEWAPAPRPVSKSVALLSVTARFDG